MGRDEEMNEAESESHQGGQGNRGPSLPYPTPTVILKFMYCLVGISTCPWPVQLAAITIYLVARCKGALVYCFQINMTSAASQNP